MWYHWHCSAHIGAQVYHMWYKAEHCAVPPALHRTGPWCIEAYTDEKFSAPRLALSIVAGPGVVGRVRRCGARWNDHICLEPVGTQQALLQPGRGGGNGEGGWGQVRMRNLNKVSLKGWKVIESLKINETSAHAHWDQFVFKWDHCLLFEKYTKIEWRVGRRIVKHIFMLTENYLSESFRMGITSYASTSLAFINNDNNPRKYFI